MERLPGPRTRGSARGRHPGPHLPGESELTPQDETPRINIPLSLEEAEAVHAILEETLEKGLGNPALEKAYRMVGWRVLAQKEGTGLTARMAAVARESESLEEYEAAREKDLGPILEGLQRGENRDP